MTRALGIAAAIALAFVPFAWPPVGVLMALVATVYLVALACGNSDSDDVEPHA